MRKANQMAKGKKQMAKVWSFESAPFTDLLSRTIAALKHFCLLPFAICLLPSLCFPAPPLEELKSEARALVDARRTFTQQMVDEIFSFSELGFQEVETSAYITGILEKDGFQI